MLHVVATKRTACVTGWRSRTVSSVEEFGMYIKYNEYFSFCSAC